MDQVSVARAKSTGLTLAGGCVMVFWRSVMWWSSWVIIMGSPGGDEPDGQTRSATHDPDLTREGWDVDYWEHLSTSGEIVLSEMVFKEETMWLLIKPIDQTPYVLSDGAVKDGWIPPKGFSGLPKAIREKVPDEYHYWQPEDDSKRREMRNALVKAISVDEISLPGLEKKETVPCSQ